MPRAPLTGHMTTTTSRRPQPATEGRAGNAVLWILQIVAAVGFLVAALGKFTGAEQVVAAFHAIGLGVWFRYLIGALEIAGAVALCIPRLAGLAAVAFVGLLVGAVITQLAIGASVAAPLPLLLVSVVIAWFRRRRTAQLWAQVAGR